MKIYVDVNTTKKDFINFQKHRMLHFIWIYPLLALTDAGIFVLMLIDQGSTGKFNGIMLFCFIVTSTLLLYMIINSLVRLMLAASAEKKKPVFSYTFTRGNIHCESNGQSFDMPLSQIYGIAEIKSMFLVYINKTDAFIIPKRCFSANEDIVEFRNNLLNNKNKN